MSSSVVDVRCPVGPKRLFTKLLLGEISASYVQPANLIEFACADCARVLNRSDDLPKVSVKHRYNFIGELVETVTTPRG
jgi:hypothetical protein